MVLVGTTDLTAANRYLEAVYRPAANAEFAIKPELSGGLRLAALGKIWSLTSSGQDDILTGMEAVSSHDGIQIRYAHCGSSRRGCIALAMPFGLRLDLADAFIRFYQSQYNVVACEPRLILDPPGRELISQDFAVDNHVKDLVCVLRGCQVSRAILVGYCSGAGIALAAANRYPQLFSTLILVHGQYVLSDESCTTQFVADIDSLLSTAAESERDARQVFEKVASDRPFRNDYIPEGVDTAFTQLHYLRRYALSYLAYKSMDFKKLAQSVIHRSLLLTGSRDVQANVESTRKIHGLMRNAEIYVDPAADHYGILREDSKTLATIWNYLLRSDP